MKTKAKKTTAPLRQHDFTTPSNGGYSYCKNCQTERLMRNSVIRYKYDDMPGWSIVRPSCPPRRDTHE